MAPLLEEPLVVVEALGAEELLALGAPHRHRFPPAPAAARATAVADLLVDVEPGLQVAEEQIVHVGDAAGLRDGRPAHGALPNGLVLAQALEAQGVEAGEELEVGRFLPAALAEDELEVILHRGRVGCSGARGWPRLGSRLHGGSGSVSI